MFETIRTFGVSLWAVLATMAPYLLLGFGVAGLLHVLIPTALVRRHLGGKGMGPVVKAALFGIPLPLCSCGVIPVAASLRKSGASSAATSSFLIATPQTGVDSIFVTYSLLGGVIAIFRPLAALISGVIGGGAVAALGARHLRHNASVAPEQRGGGASGAGGKLAEALRYGFWTLPGDIGRSLLVGLVIASLITVVLPPGKFADVFGTGMPAMFAMLALGVPIYVCATASVPVAAALIVTQGVSPGAALVFLMTGPATNLATIVTVARIMGRRTAVVYLAVVMVTALASGLALDALGSSVAVVPAPHEHAMAGGWTWVRHGSGLILLALLLSVVVRGAFARLLTKSRSESEGDAAPEHLVLNIEGMTCTHCARSVERALAECEGVNSATVDLPVGTARVRGQDLDTDGLCSAVRALGYGASTAGHVAGDPQLRNEG